MGVGNVRLKMLFKVSKPKQAVMYNVLYVPQLACNLFSVGAAASKGNTVKLGHSKYWMQDRNGKLCGMGSLVDKMYQLDCQPVSMECASTASEQRNDADLWHQHLGHVNGQQLKQIIQKELATGVRFPKTAELSFCKGCVEGKMHQKPFKPLREIHLTQKLRLVHSDVCGPMSIESIGGQKCFIAFIDDYSRCCAVYFLKHKSQVLEKFKEFEADVTNESGQRIGTLRTDNGAECLSRESRPTCSQRGYVMSKG